MYKKLLGVLIVPFFTWSSFLIPMDWNNKSYQIDLNDPRAWDLLSQNNSVENSEPITKEAEDFVNSVIDTDKRTGNNQFSKNVLSPTIVENNESTLAVKTPAQIVSNKDVSKNNTGAKFSIPCPVCLKVFQNNQTSVELFREFYGHVVCEIASHNPSLKQKFDEIMKQSKPCCFKCGSSIATESTIQRRAIYIHLGCKHLAEIFDEYAQNVVIPGLPSTIKEFYSYCSQQCPSERQRKTWKHTVPCQLAGCKKILHSNEFPSEVKNKYLLHIVRHIIKAGDLKATINEFLKNRRANCVFDNCAVEMNQAPNLNSVAAHLASYHIDDLLAKHPVITKSAIETYLQSQGIVKKIIEKKTAEKRKKSSFACQVCGKKIEGCKTPPSETKRKYLCHLMIHVVDGVEYQEYQKFNTSCYLCNEVQKSYGIYKHLVDKHLEEVFAQNGIITQEEVETCLKEHGIVERPRKKRELTGSISKNDTVDEVLSFHKQENESTSTDQFLNVLDEKCAGPKETLSIEEIEKHLGI